MKKTFDEDAKRFLNEGTGGPEGYDNGEFLRKWALYINSTSYKITKDRNPIGAIILWKKK